MSGGQLYQAFVDAMDQCFTYILKIAHQLPNYLQTQNHTRFQEHEHKPNSNATQATNKPTKRQKVAVFFGGRSPEHDVSVITGLQVLQAIDSLVYEPFPVYIAPDGRWLTGGYLLDRAHYLLSSSVIEKLLKQGQLFELVPNVSQTRRPKLLVVNQQRLTHPKEILFDVALLAFHGLNGEDGHFQGLFEVANIPYTGMRAKASTVLMDKHATKLMLEALHIPVLPYALIKRPIKGYFVSIESIKQALGEIQLPCILKPSHLGSSIGVAKVKTFEDIQGCLPAIFEYDTVAIVEPFVDHLVEYNVSVSKSLGVKKSHTINISAFEKPKTSEELLDFKEKYLAGGGAKGGGTKAADVCTSTNISQGMLSLTREINPKLSPQMHAKLKQWAVVMFEALDGSGLPRIDFISNGETGEIWLNEVNPIPGSFGYFLWEAATPRVLFTDLLTGLIEEAFELAQSKSIPKDPVPEEARLLKRQV